MSFSTARIERLTGVTSVNGVPFSPSGGTSIQPQNTAGTYYVNFTNLLSGAVSSLFASAAMLFDPDSSTLHIRNLIYPLSFGGQPDAPILIQNQSLTPYDLTVRNLSGGSLVLDSSNAPLRIIPTGGEGVNKQFLRNSGSGNCLWADVPQTINVFDDGVGTNDEPSVLYSLFGSSLSDLKGVSKFTYAPLLGILYPNKIMPKTEPVITALNAIVLNAAQVKAGLIVLNAGIGAVSITVPTGANLSAELLASNFKEGSTFSLFVANPSSLTTTLITSLGNVNYSVPTSHNTSFYVHFVNTGVATWTYYH